ncbi:hypothetical protein [Streptomyces sp. NPDC059452]|uniref:hypothetical protein n=1 Tax=Streptomyces sp. NPDC059452 TaxID=3346835 RepID=UPI0036A3ABBE
MATIAARTVEYPADGLTMTGHLALPAGVDRRPAVLLGPEGMALDVLRTEPRTDPDRIAAVGHPTAPGVGYHPRHAQRAWRDVVDLLTECLPVKEELGA